MTTIQAIDLLKGLEQSLDDYCELNDEGKTAFRMAITALEVFGLSEQLPSAQPEKRTEERAETHACDLIDRQAAIDALKNRWKKTRNYEGIGDDIAEECELYLKQVPSAKPERKTGRWIDDHCSECGQYVYHGDVRNFCPNCGTKMLKDGDDIDS